MGDSGRAGRSKSKKEPEGSFFIGSQIDVGRRVPRIPGLLAGVVEQFTRVRIAGAAQVKGEKCELRQVQLMALGSAPPHHAEVWIERVSCNTRTTRPQQSTGMITSALVRSETLINTFINTQRKLPLTRASTK